MTGSPSHEPGGAPPPHRGWPLRLPLSLALLGCVLLSVVVLVAAHRGESTAGSVLAELIGLPARVQPVQQPLRLLALKEDGQWRVVDLAADPKVVEEAQAAILAGKLATVSYTFTADSIQRSGLWAPTSLQLMYTMKRSPGTGAGELSPEDSALALAAAAEQLETRSLWKAIADTVRESGTAGTGSDGETSGAVEARLKRGWLLNIATIFAGVLLLLSLARTPGTIHEMYDIAVGFGRKLGGAAVLGLVWTACPAVLGILLLYYLAPIAKFLRVDPTLGWFGYVAVFIVSAGIGFLPTYGQSFLGGWVFGFARGFPGAMLGFVGGSVIGYFIAQRVSKDRVVAVLEGNPRARKVRNALIGKSFWRTCAIVTLIRVPPNSPFALTNLVLASSGVGLGPYIIGTALGMAPRTAIAVWLAAKGASTGAQDIADFVESQPWWMVPLGAVIFVGVLSILGWIGNRALHEVTKDIPDVDAAAD